ncbi:MAG TPA: hypothetical protein VFB28_05545 [Terriglobales bacterium]|nr:hypothetical protein [Terriglobales bacterium]
MSTAVIQRDIIDAIIGEMASGVDRAVECWMAQIDEVLSDSRLTSLGRLQAVRQVLEKYKQVTGKERLHRRAE